MRPCLSLLLIVLAVTAGYAQVPVRGTVTDESGKPLAGVSIQLKSTKQFAVAKDDGSFQLPVTDLKTAVLAATYTGYLAQEIALNGMSTVSFSLAPTKNNLDEVT